METVYLVELRHQEAPGDSSDREDEEGTMGNHIHVARDWLCVWIGAEHFCVNTSRRLWDQGRGELNARLSHSLSLLNASGTSAKPQQLCCDYIPELWQNHNIWNVHKQLALYLTLFTYIYVYD